MIGQQLALAVHLRDAASFETYFTGPNVDAVAALRALAGPTLIHGPQGSGRTHLLQAVARARAAAYLPLHDFAIHGPAILEGFEDRPVLCLDDVDAACADPLWCVALARLLDQRRAAGSALLLAAEAAPERLRIALPDLRTRLQACAAFGLKPLADTDRVQLLRERAQQRGLELPLEVARWITHTQARDTETLLAALDRLDRASLSAQRRLTLPFAQAVLGERA